MSPAESPPDPDPPRGDSPPALLAFDDDRDLLELRRFTLEAGPEWAE